MMRAMFAMLLCYHLAHASFFQIQQPFACRYHQLIFDASHEVLEESEGILAVDRKHNVLWRPDDPDQNLIKIEGKHLWVIDVGLQQASQFDALHMDALQSPLALLSGDEAKIKPLMHITQTHQHGRLEITATPLQESPFKSFHLTLKEGRPVRLDIETKTGLSHQLTFDAAPWPNEMEWLRPIPNHFDVITEGESRHVADKKH